MALLLIGCGKKTDPIPKEALENIAIPKKVIVQAQPEGVFIANNENALLIIEKAESNGEACPEYKRIKVLEPKADFIDTSVKADNAYYYRLTKKTLKYKLLSDPRVFPIIYQIPPVITNASFTSDAENITVNIEASKEFMRMDIYSGRKLVSTTGKTTATIPTEEISNKLTVRLTDYFGNKGDVYTLNITPPKVVVTPKKVTGLAAANIGGTLRVVWDSTFDNLKYEIKVCENVSCETLSSPLPFLVYKKEFDKCINITVNALSENSRSEDSSIRFCK